MQNRNYKFLPLGSQTESLIKYILIPFHISVFNCSTLATRPHSLSSRRRRLLFGQCKLRGDRWDPWQLKKLAAASKGRPSVTFRFVPFLIPSHPQQTQADRIAVASQLLHSHFFFYLEIYSQLTKYAAAAAVASSPRWNNYTREFCPPDPIQISVSREQFLFFSRFPVAARVQGIIYNCSAHYSGDSHTDGGEGRRSGKTR